MKNFILILFLSINTFAADVNERANISKRDYIIMQLNISLIQTIDKYKPFCSSHGASDIHCIGFIQSKSRKKFFKEKLTKLFGELVKEQGVEGKIILQLPNN